MPYAEISQQRIHYQDTGGDGPTIVFSHGFLMDHEMWAPQIAALGDQYRCIAWDERGWGQTESPKAPFDYWDLAADCIGLLGHLRVDEAVLCGLSQGGFLSMRAALRDPSRVKGLALLDTSPRAETAQGRALYQALYDTAVADGLGDELAAAVTAVLFGPGFDASYWVGKMRARPAAAMRHAVDSLSNRDDVTDRLGEISCPTLVVHGELDASFPADEVESWAGHLGNLVGVERIPGAGHTANLEMPGAVNSALTSFLAEF